MTTTIAGIWVNILERKTTEGVFTIKDGKIYSFEEQPVNEKQYILPGFIDAHIHIESSMLVPYEFARIALTHGTVATISDPHEIANVLGVDGVYYMLENAKDALLKFNFGAPSCVPVDSSVAWQGVARSCGRVADKMRNAPGSFELGAFDPRGGSLRPGTSQRLAR